MPEWDVISSELKKGLVKSISDAAYTLGDFGLDTGVQYDTFIFTSLTADRALNLPTLADNQGYAFEVISLDGDYGVDITPEGSEDINDWNSTFQINQQNGHVRIIGLSDRWLLTPLNDACVYEVSSETADTGLALDGTWDDVTGMTLLNGIYGKGYLDVFANQVGNDSGCQYVSLYFGIGKTSGNNIPDISYGGGEYDVFQTYHAAAATNYQLRATRSRSNIPYESDGSTIYMKARIYTDVLNAAVHTVYGATNAPMYIKFIRKY